MSENRKSKKNLLSVIIPIALAVAVILGLAVSGNITKKRDLDNPTASVSQAVTQTTVAPDTKVISLPWEIILFTILSSPQVSRRTAQGIIPLFMRI